MPELFNPYGLFHGCFVPNCIMEYEELTPSDKLVWARLVQHSGRDGVCYPKQSVLAKETGMSERTVVRSIQNLIDAGFIHVENAAGADRFSKRNNTYYFIKHPVFNEISPCDKLSLPAMTKCQTQISKTSISKQKHISNARENDFASLLPKSFQSNAKFLATWRDFVSYRKTDKRKPLSDISAKRIARTLWQGSQHDAATAIEMLNRSIENGWTGVFVKANNNSTSGGKRTIGYGHQAKQKIYGEPDIIINNEDYL